MQPEERIGIVLMTYGSATNAAGVPEYLAHIYGKTPSDEAIAEFKRRYDRIGGSPLVEITNRQAAALEEMLGPDFVVRAGMRHSKPFISDAVVACRESGATRLVGIILSPQFSSFIMEGYRTSLTAAAAEAGFAPESVNLVEAWPDEEEFVALIAERIEGALAAQTEDASVIFTTHSLPERVIANDPGYLTQLETTRAAILACLRQPLRVWRAAYQSAGHSPEAWLKPDLTDILQMLRDAGENRVLIVPIQFLSDHLEVLYDLDVAAREQCEEYGISYARIALPNDDPRFVIALASIARRAARST